MKVLITGAAGFIGKHVTETLKGTGHEVITLDMPHYGSMDLAVDITQPLDPIPGLDAVIHLAAVSHPRDCDNAPGRAFDVNVNGTHQVLNMALESGVRKVVFASTAHVYGISPKYLPTDEIHPLWLQNNYTLTKILGEQLCQLYHDNHGLSYTVLRLFNAYGPGQGLGYFIPDMIGKAKDKGITLPGANTTKDWVYVDDVARAFLLAMESPYVGAINIGTGVETELFTIAEHIARAYTVPFSFSPVEGATRMWADVTRAKRILGWEPYKTIREGLRDIIGAEKAYTVPA